LTSGRIKKYNLKDSSTDHLQTKISMVKTNNQNNTIYAKAAEFLAVSALSISFLLTIIFHMLYIINRRPLWLDHWQMCYTLQNQVTRILGLNPGGIWNGGFYYPFHANSILFDEPSWGISLLIAPIWIFTNNIFPILRMGGIIALFLAWISVYYFVKKLSNSRIWSFFAAAAFCLSGIGFLLIVHQLIFWPFFLIPLLGLIILKIFSSPKISWGIAYGIILGYLAWSSAHLFIMGGVFLCLLILWHLLYCSHAKKILSILFIGHIIAAAIAGTVLVSMYLTHAQLEFFRGYHQPQQYASNWANLIYRNWPAAPFNFIAKTPLWEYLKIHAKGETNIGISIFLLLGALLITAFRLTTSASGHIKDKHSQPTFIFTIIAAIFLGFINILALRLKCLQLSMPLPQIATNATYLYYIAGGIIIFFLRKRITTAMKHLDCFLLLSALLFGFLSFGPYYLTSNERVIASPVAFLIYHVPGFSGIQATARWGLMLSFVLSIAVALFLSQYKTNRRLKLWFTIFVLLALSTIIPGFRLPKLKYQPPYQWTPRETDIFLKNLPGNGAVLELSSYPLKQEQKITSDNSLGYSWFSRLYHKKPIITGYSSYTPHVIQRYLFNPKDKTLSPGVINRLRKFGAKYWVFHIESWTKEQVLLFESNMAGLKLIGKLDNGQTLIYEDPVPKTSVSYLNIIQ